MERKNIEMVKCGLVAWYDFVPEARILCIGMDDYVAAWLREKGYHVENCEINELCDWKSRQIYDYVIALYGLERSDSPNVFLEVIYDLLKEDGTLLLGTDNRFGIRYFSGEKDPYTNRMFEGIEGYRNVPEATRNGRCYGKEEIRELISSSGFYEKVVYNAFPNIEIPQLLYHEGVVPAEQMSARYISKYQTDAPIFLFESNVCDGLSRNGLLDGMANSFLFVYKKSDDSKNKDHDTIYDSITLAMGRVAEKASVTLIHDGIVEKKAPFKEGNKSIRQLHENEKYLSDRGLPVIESNLDENVYSTSFVSAEPLNTYLQKTAIRDKELFVQRMDEFKALIEASSDIVGEGECGPILEKGFLDLVPLNCFWTEKGFLIFDQEYCEERIPSNLILLRTLIIVYDNPIVESVLPRSFFYERYGLSDHMIALLGTMERQFVASVRMIDDIVEGEGYRDIYPPEIEKNRQRIENGISIELVFKDYIESCFSDIKEKKVYVFGSGRFADKFMAFYSQTLTISGVVDNNIEKWGQFFYDHMIESPDILRDLDENCKVIICIKDYAPIFRQIKELGVKYIGIYDAHYMYPGRQMLFTSGALKASDKPYRVGYVSGVFDMFHFGHVNLLRRAKELCDYLIVAVTADEYVRERKDREPVVPFEERLEVIRACRYTDEAVGVPFNYMGTVEAFEAYHFDAQFCGSDYADDPWWMEQKAWLEERGATLHIFPYTEQTSSTKLVSLIEQRML